MEEKLNYRLTLRLYKEKKVFGAGMAQLLELIERQQSLSKAAQSMHMSYSKAWTMLRTAEKELGYGLIVRSVGGKDGGGSVLTEEARHMLAAYQAFSESLETEAARLFHKFYDDMEQNILLHKFVAGSANKQLRREDS